MLRKFLLKYATKSSFTLNTLSHHLSLNNFPFFFKYYPLNYHSNSTHFSTFKFYSVKCNYSTSYNCVKFIYYQKRSFAGRQRGLKRRKAKKEPRRIQVALGRRLELFWPKKRRKLRIRLVQNSRGNVIFDPVLKKFMVFYYKQGTQVFRGFSAKGSKFEIARSKALNFARQMADYYLQRLDKIRQKYGTNASIELNKKLGFEPTTQSSDGFDNNHSTVQNGVKKSDYGLKSENAINYSMKLQPDCNLSGVRGVFFDSKTSSWVAKYNEFGVRKYKFFSTNEFGFQESYKNAVDFLRFQLYKSHQFLHRRHRTRKNRPILK